MTAHEPMRRPIRGHLIRALSFELASEMGSDHGNHAQVYGSGHTSKTSRMECRLRERNEQGSTACWAAPPAKSPLQWTFAITHIPICSPESRKHRGPLVIARSHATAGDYVVALANWSEPAYLLPAADVACAAAAWPSNSPHMLAHKR